MFELTNMIKYLSLVVLASFLALTAYSQQSPTATAPKITDLGVINVSDGIPSSHRLADGRPCVLTPTILKDGQINLRIRVGDTNAASIHTLSTYFEPDRRTIFGFDQSNAISLTLHIPK